MQGFQHAISMCELYGRNRILCLVMEPCPFLSYSLQRIFTIPCLFSGVNDQEAADQQMIIQWIASVFGLIISDKDEKKYIAYIAQFAPVLQRLLGHEVRQWLGERSILLTLEIDSENPYQASQLRFHAATVPRHLWSQPVSSRAFHC